MCGCFLVVVGGMQSLAEHGLRNGVGVVREKSRKFLGE